MEVGLSTVEVNGIPKDKRRKIVYYEKYRKYPFQELPKMLVKDYIYSPFGFKYNCRGVDNVNTNTSIVVLDVDDTTIDAFDRHQQLIDENLSHIIATTSNKSNLFKYRVILPLSTEVASENYRGLVKGIRDHKLIADMDYSASAKFSQPFYSYKGSQVFTFFEGTSLSVKDYEVEDTLEELNISELSKLDYQEKRMYLLEKFSEAFIGSRRRTLVKASFDMLELGFTQSQFRDTVITINKRWIQPMSQRELRLWVINPFLRKFKGK